MPASVSTYGLSLLILVLLWQLAAALAESRVLPLPLAVLAVPGEGLASGELLYHLALTLARVAAARFGLAPIWKIVLVVELLGRSNGVGFQL
ncbi:MAG: hypothetical protein MI785_19925 [Kiloniellales bacterium]|nr:hypothetical protein [Kiloniellales bacterium]